MRVRPFFDVYITSARRSLVFPEHANLPAATAGMGDPFLHENDEADDASQAADVGMFRPD